MIKKLQNIYEIVQQNETLPAEEKEELLSLLNQANKELEIISFKLERTEKVKKTTTILLEQTIQELELKRIAVEKSNTALQKKLEELIS